MLTQNRLQWWKIKVHQDYHAIPEQLLTFLIT